ncbi:pyrroline-5-carboxylate reductase [Mariniblastus sp.]|nr:pyrroline-5-carboxylate reductase [bacterium]MDA7903593.1 pyrroline-5-carboxylate reductase [Mariniblastus sp.]MDB4374382.1 pyrroline-5-carboxylate reductase [bacterium]MDB4490374.1 pyrroline-5-carboxylate reductase [bacterium]MDC0294211.1 pyrroline-5-carboxylate reductase [Mariniblastus sp.]
MNNIGFIGAGQMAKALAVGIAQPADQTINFFISDPCDDACASFAQLVGEPHSITRVEGNQQLAESSELIFLAVKPQYLHDAIEDVEFEHDPLICSIVAGVRSIELQRLTGSRRIIRMMPNRPCLIGMGACGMTADPEVSPSDRQTLKTMLEPMAVVVEVSEAILDSVTGLSGSGPAFVFTFIESLIDGAVLTGMPRATARQLAIQTVLGSAKMLLETGDHPAILRDSVASPGGTTIEGIKALEENSFRDAVISAVQAATERSRELG